MGMTPIEGLIMGTRTGDVDAGALLHIAEKEGIGFQTLNKLINKFSGLLGISGISSDMRDLEEAAAKGHERAIIALNMFRYRVKKYVGAYTAAMGGVDAIVFTGGIGENDAASREEIMKDMEWLGIDFDFEKNRSVKSQENIITREDSKVKVMVIPTNEELVIASDTYEIVTRNLEMI
jgi:acetate kinase